jgi:hypothetical protein
MTAATSRPQPRCPLCGAAETRITGLERLHTGAVAFGLLCQSCGERWAVDDDGHVVGIALAGGGL